MSDGLTRFTAAADPGKALRELENKLGRMPVYRPVRSVTTATTIVDSDAVIAADATGGAITVTLPVAAKNRGREFWVIRLNGGANAVTLDGADSETINGATTLALGSQYAVAHIVCTGTAWLRIGN